MGTVAKLPKLDPIAQAYKIVRDATYYNNYLSRGDAIAILTAVQQEIVSKFNDMIHEVEASE